MAFCEYAELRMSGRCVRESNQVETAIVAGHFLPDITSGDDGFFFERPKRDRSDRWSPESLEREA